MKVLLIGGTGILSTDIVEESLNRNYDVYIINRGHRNNIIDKRVKIIIGDIRNVEQIKQKLGNEKFDVVIDFLSFHKEQLENTLKIFQNRCDQFIFISSATAYRKTEKGELITEKTELRNDNWDYARGKIECEELLKENYKSNKQCYTIIRPYVTYSNRRIPFAIIPSEQWTLANRILLEKPILLWDGGKAICTLTQTKDFAKGIVGLFKNPKAYQEDFHITTDYTLTWKEALEDIGKALGKKPIIADIPSKYISKYLPEYEGVLFGDKGLDRIFDNTKIKEAVPDFNAQTKFEDGIKETIKYYNEHPEMKIVNYSWDARIDALINKYYKSIKKKDYDKTKLTLKSYKNKLDIKQKIKYLSARNIDLYNLLKKAKHIVKRG